MALTEQQINKIAVILGVPKRLVNAQIQSLGLEFTAQDETDVIAEIARWDAGAGSSFVSFTPTESNKGFNLRSGFAQADIRNNIAVLLDWDLAVSSSGIGTIEIGR